MRSLFAAAAVVVFAVLTFSRSVQAGEELPSVQRPIAEQIAVLEKLPKAKSELALVRFYGEVLGGKTVKVYPALDKDETGSSHALSAIEAELYKSCAALGPTELAAATALTKQYGDVLPAVMRAYTLGQQGKKDEASKMFAAYLDEVAPLKGECNATHPDYANEAITHVSFALRCMEAFTPKRDLSRAKKQVEKVMTCVLNSHVVG